MPQIIIQLSLIESMQIDQKVTQRILNIIPAQWRGDKQRFLYIFQSPQSLIFEYETFHQGKRQLLWLVYDGKECKQLTFVQMSDCMRVFKQGKLSWNEKTAIMENEEKIELKVIYRKK